jgi:hypothetical protein
MTKDFAGYQCWMPERIGVVINKEALSVERANFLATHVPMRRIGYERSPQHITEASELSLLDELEQAAVDDRHVFAAIKGIPGTGKSHLIRWLKEQYALTHPRDAVLLIARANTSLRATIQQIIDSHVFDQDTLPEQLKRLQNAVEVLSHDTLAEKLINGLQEATRVFSKEDVYRYIGTIHPRVTPTKVEHFLLDHNVRIALKRESGPIERIATFLSTGTGTNLGLDRLPGFEATDFRFEVHLLRQIKEGAYPEVKGFCDDLHLKPEICESLARYLNFALHNYAISNATQLAAGDLRTMFNDLRRHLRHQNRNLALFIEDITAFTGIDEGLIEVLIAQHKGETNAEFCRLTSVIGATDSYYADRFPDNIKDRVTHLLTLNSRTSRNESDLLQDTQIRAEFAARYLNAMRASQLDLTTWAEHGAQPDAIPNACERCAFRRVCHAAFGYVELRDERGAGMPIPVGLYPFNQSAINTLYDFLKEGVSRTPRSLLNNIIAYVLTSHGDRIAAGEFPPSVTDLANDVEPPTLSPPLHSRIIQQQGGTDAKRLTTLFLFWGDRNVYAYNRSGTLLVGGLSPDVFRAFKLKGIAGATDTPEKQGTSEQVSLQDEEVSNTKKIESRNSKYAQYISDWENGGKLFAYNEFANWLADLARSFIDWQAHGISASQVREYVTSNRLFIEGQSGAIPFGRYQLHFDRTKELTYVLQALADLNDNTITVQPDQYGEHLATLSHWLRDQEQRIVQFVREPTLQAPPHDYLVQILLKDCVLLACLSGDLDASASLSSGTLYQQVVASCAKSTKDSWKERIEHLRGTHPAEWINLMRKLDTQDAVHLCRTELLQLLNRPQGASTNVRYLDAALALTTLADFNTADWHLSPLTVKPQTNDPVWSSAIRIYEVLTTGFEAAIEASRKKLEQEHAKLMSFLEDETPQVVFDAMRDLLAELRQVREYPAELDVPFTRITSVAPLTPGELTELETDVRQFFTLIEMQAQAASISMRYGDWTITLQKYLRYLGTFVKAAGEQKTKLKEDVVALRAKSDAEAKSKQVHRRFDEAIKILEPYAEQATS